MISTYIYNKQQASLAKSRDDEQLLTTKLLERNQQNVVSKASPRQDIEQHCDLWLTSPVTTRTIGIDVKGFVGYSDWDPIERRKVYHNDCLWVEMTNVNGEDGSIKGDAYYMAYRLKYQADKDSKGRDKFLLVKRQLLKDYVDSNLVSDTVGHEKKPYHLYQREGRQDVLVLVPLKDVMTLKPVII